MFTEDVTELDFDEDRDNDENASLYPSSPELDAARTSAALRDQMSFEDILSPMSDRHHLLLAAAAAAGDDNSEPVVSDDGSVAGGSGGVGERSFSPAGSNDLLLGGTGTGSFRRNRRRRTDVDDLLDLGPTADAEDIALGAALAAAAAATGGPGLSKKGSRKGSARGL